MNIVRTLGTWLCSVFGVRLPAPNSYALRHFPLPKYNIVYYDPLTQRNNISKVITIPMIIIVLVFKFHNDDRFLFFFAFVTYLPLSTQTIFGGKCIVYLQGTSLTSTHSIFTNYYFRFFKFCTYLNDIIRF